MKNKYTISIAIFLIAIIGFGIFSFIDPDKTFSDSENRELAKMPSFGFSSYLDASFMKDFETYFSDQFPLRNSLISFSKAYKSLMFPNFFISEDDVITLPPTNVSAGNTEDTEAVDDGELTGEIETVNPEVLNGSMIYGGRIMEVFTVKDATVTRYTNIIKQLKEECGNPDTYVLIPPPAYTLYAPDSHKTESTDFNHAFEMMTELLDGITVVDVRDKFLSMKDQYLYFKTDHHWTAFGAYQACNEFLKAAGNPTLPSLDTYVTGEREGYLGSLYKAIMANQLSAMFENNQDTVRYFIPFAEASVTSYTTATMSDPTERQVIYPDYSRNTNLYNVYMGGDIPLGHITTNVGNGKSIMVVRDSYGHAFIPFLVDAYEDIWLIEPRYFNNEGNKFELGKFFIEHELDTLLFLGYPNMSIGAYWYTLSQNLEYLVNLPLTEEVVTEEIVTEAVTE